MSDRMRKTIKQSLQLADSKPYLLCMRMGGGGGALSSKGKGEGEKQGRKQEGVMDICLKYQIFFRNERLNQLHSYITHLLLGTRSSLIENCFTCQYNFLSSWVRGIARLHTNCNYVFNTLYEVTDGVPNNLRGC